jgi:hypothetical protein
MLRDWVVVSRMKPEEISSAVIVVTVAALIPRSLAISMRAIVPAARIFSKIWCRGGRESGPYDGFKGPQPIVDAARLVASETSFSFILKLNRWKFGVFRRKI